MSENKIVIKRTNIVTHYDIDEFEKALDKILESYQLEGLDVELQYRFTDTHYSVMIIGRSNGNNTSFYF